MTTTEERVKKLERGITLVLIAVSLLILAACTAPTRPSPCDQPVDGQQIVPGVGVGPYILLKSTRREILGEANAEELRNRLEKEGLHFQFERGRELTGVAVMSAAFRTAGGLRVGSTADEVRREFGQPEVEVKEEMGDPQGEGLRLPGLGYPSVGISFLLENGKVRAVMVMPRRSGD